MKFIESLVKVVKGLTRIPRENIKKFDSPTTLPINLEDDMLTRSMFNKRSTIAYSDASRIYREQ